MKSIKLKGLTVGLDKPVVAAEGTGRIWMPMLARFESGTLVTSFALVPDIESVTSDVLSLNCGVCFSKDDGKTWFGHAPGGQTLNAALPDDSLLCLPPAFRFDPPNQRRDLRAHYLRLTEGGRSFVHEFDGLRVIGIPRDIKAEKSGIPVFYPSLSALRLRNGSLLILYYVIFEGDHVREHKHPMFYPPDSTVLAFTSGDSGRTWEYTGAVAGPADLPNAMEGPDEVAATLLEDGRILAVIRIGQHEKWEFLRCYSSDDGRTWSTPVKMPGVFSVMPCLRRLHNGVLALSAGRPGMFLWLCTDGVGETWQRVDVVAHHNASVAAKHRIGRVDWDGALPPQTSVCTSMVEIAPNELLMVYDRIPFGWDAVPTDSTERDQIFALRISVSRKRRPRPTVQGHGVDPRLEVVQRPESPLGSSAPARSGRMRLRIKNEDPIARKGQIELKIGPGRGAIVGAARIAYALSPGQSREAIFEVRPAPGAQQIIVGAKDPATREPPVWVSLYVRKSCIGARLPHLGSIDRLPEAMRKVPAHAIKSGRHVLARVRLAAAGEFVALHANVIDRRIERAADPWEGSCVELFATASAAEKTGHLLGSDDVRHVYLMPATDSLAAKALLDKSGRPEVEDSIQLLTQRTTNGYELSALVPAQFLGADPRANELLLEVQVTAATGAGGDYRRGALFGSHNAFENTLWYGRVTLNRSGVKRRQDATRTARFKRM